jgi:hypothetical protein
VKQSASARSCGLQHTSSQGTKVRLLRLDGHSCMKKQLTSCKTASCHSGNGGSSAICSCRLLRKLLLLVLLHCRKQLLLEEPGAVRLGTTSCSTWSQRVLLLAVTILLLGFGDQGSSPTPALLQQALQLPQQAWSCTPWSDLQQHLLQHRVRHSVQDA